MCQNDSMIDGRAVQATQTLDVQGRAGADSPLGAAAQTGFILVPVIFVLALLALVTMTLTRTVTHDVRASAQVLHQAEAESLADGLARLVIRNLVVAKSEADRRGPVRVDGTPLSCRIGASVIAVSVKDTAGQIDLNLASRDLLQRLFTGIGLSTDQAVRLAAAVIDFRDPDNIPIADGAEAADYRAAGLSHGPKNAPFATVGELEQVFGMTPQIMARVRPLVTVYSRARGIDPSVASAEIRALDLPSALLAVPAQRSFLVRIGIHHARNVRVVRELVVELAPRVPVGFLIKDWGRGVSANDVEPRGDIADLPACLDLFVSAEP